MLNGLFKVPSNLAHDWNPKYIIGCYYLARKFLSAGGRYMSPKRFQMAARTTLMMHPFVAF